MSSDAHVLDGVVPASVSAPMNAADLSAVLKRAATDRQTIGVQGGGTKSDQGNPPRSLDLLVSTTGMNRIVEHAAGDLVVTAQAGVPLETLQQHVAAAGQWLALDPPETGATIGGIVATAASGPRRLLFGTPRDLLIGITVVLADGTIAKSGGKVVKNVAGYDLGKLYTGSFGSLGVIAECTFRLHPRPAARRVVTAEVDDPAIATRKARATGAMPTAIEWDGGTLTVLIESIESACERQAEDVQAAIGGSVADTLPADFGRRPDSPVLLKVTHRLGALREVLGVLGARLPGSPIRAHAGSGVVWLGADDLAALEPLRSAVAAYDGSVVVVRAPAKTKAGVDVWGPVRGLDVMRRIKAQFDPECRLSPGRFVGGL